MTLTYQTSIEGLDRQIAALNGFLPVMMKHESRAMQQVTGIMQLGWMGRVPGGASGGYGSSIEKEVRTLVGGQVVGIVGTSRTSPRGFPYPVALEKGTYRFRSGASGFYHYRSTPRRGQRTMDHVKKAFKGVTKSVDKFFQMALDRIMREIAK